MHSIVETQGRKGATGNSAQSIRDEVRHLWGRLQLQLPQFGKDQIRIAFCSTHPGEGATSVAANFGIFLGGQNRRTTLVECNLRHPSLADHFGVPRSPGISEYLDGSARIDQALRRDAAGGLDILPAGSPPADVYAALGNEGGIERLLTDLGRDSEFMILDVPPLSQAPESASILRAVDATILVVQAHRTRKQSALKSLQTFDELGVACCGIVLNRMHYDVPPFIDQIL